MNDDARVPAPPPRVVAAAFSLAIDAVTVEVVVAFRAAGIRCILLKGPALARLLYEDGSDRPYGDVDLLVAPEDTPRAEQVLSGLDFVPPPDVVHFRPLHATSWRRGPLNVDLHENFVGIDRPSADVWTALTGATDRMIVDGVDVEVLGPAATAFQVALHAAQHGIRVAKPLRDLARALERFPESTWAAAASLADRLEATPAFATGLRLLPAGEVLADRLGLPRRRPAEVALRATTPAPVSRGFARLERTSGFAAKAALLVRELVPKAEFMRSRSRLARRGRVGLVAAYLWRPWWLLWHAGPALRAWRLAKKEARGGS